MHARMADEAGSLADEFSQTRHVLGPLHSAIVRHGFSLARSSQTDLEALDEVFDPESELNNPPKLPKMLLAILRGELTDETSNGLHHFRMCLSEAAQIDLECGIQSAKVDSVWHNGLEYRTKSVVGVAIQHYRYSDEVIRVERLVRRAVELWRVFRQCIGAWRLVEADWCFTTIPNHSPALRCLFGLLMLLGAGRVPGFPESPRFVASTQDDNQFGIGAPLKRLSWDSRDGKQACDFPAFYCIVRDFLQSAELAMRWMSELFPQFASVRNGDELPAAIESVLFREFRVLRHPRTASGIVVANKRRSAGSTFFARGIDVRLLCSQGIVHEVGDWPETTFVKAVKPFAYRGYEFKPGDAADMRMTDAIEFEDGGFVRCLGEETIEVVALASFQQHAHPLCPLIDAGQHIWVSKAEATGLIQNKLAVPVVAADSLEQNMPLESAEAKLERGSTDEPPRFWEQHWDAKSSRKLELCRRLGAVALNKERSGVGPEKATPQSLPKLRHLQRLCSTVQSRCGTETFLAEILPPTIQLDIVEIADSLDLWPFPLFYFGPRASLYDPYFPEMFAILDADDDHGTRPIETRLIDELAKWAATWVAWCEDEVSAITTAAVSRPSYGRRTPEPLPTGPKFNSREWNHLHAFLWRNGVVRTTEKAEYLQLFTQYCREFRGQSDPLTGKRYRMPDETTYRSIRETFKKALQGESPTP